MEKNRTYYLKIVFTVLMIIAICGYATQSFAASSTSLTKVTGINTNITGQRVEINWNKVQGANGYEVIFTMPNSKTQWKYNWYYNAIIFSNFPYGNRYKVEVRAFNATNGQKNYGAFSEAKFFDVKDDKNEQTKELTQVTGVSTLINGQNLTIKWNKVAAAEGYYVEFTVPRFNTKWTYNCTSNQINFSNFPFGNRYKVEIKAFNTVNGQKNYGKASNEVYFSIKQDGTIVDSGLLDKVTNVIAKVNGRSIVFNWNEVEVSDGYEVVITNANFNTKWTYYWSFNKMSFSNFPAGRGYKVKIKAYKFVNGVKQYGKVSDAVSFSV